MPWKKSDVDKHKKGLTDKQKAKWVSIANSALKQCQDNGGKDCEAKAIITANSQIKESMNEIEIKYSEAIEKKMQEAWYKNLMAQLEQALREKYTDAFVFIIDFDDNNIIYEYEPKSDESLKYYKINYTIDDSGNVTFGDPFEVVKQVRYEPVESKRKQPELPFTENTVATEDHTPIKLIESPNKDGNLKVKIIQPGWGSSGYYSKETLQKAAPVYKEGLKMYIDHPTREEEAERPERSTRDVAAVLTSDAYFDENGKEGPGLYADAKVFSDYQQFIKERAPYIGLSHRASGKAYQGEAEGKEGPIISEIHDAHSVDFVTMPGAGGQITELYESYRNTNNNTQTKINMDEKELKEAKEKLEKENQELQEAKKKLEEENQRYREAQLTSQAKGIVQEELKESNLPDVTKQRLVEQLSTKYEVKEGKIDEDKFKEKIKEAVKAEAQYLSQIMGQGNIKGFGESEGGNDGEVNMEEATQYWMDMGYSKEMAKQMVNGRN